MRVHLVITVLSGRRNGCGADAGRPDCPHSYNSPSRRRIGDRLASCAWLRDLSPAS
jgi:hypothetical protein